MTNPCTPDSAAYWRWEAQHATAKYDMLRRAVEMFLDRPGCNNAQKGLALRKLRWALEETQK